MMEILNVRVDDRLVHGVVATNWIPRLNVARVIVIDKESANNPMLKSVLRMATPKNVNLSVITAEKTLDNFRAQRYGNEKIMIVVKALEPILELIEGGFHIDKLILGNLGNQQKTDSTTVLTRYVSVDESTIPQLKKIADSGVQVVAQLIPEDSEEPVMELMKKKGLI